WDPDFICFSPLTTFFEKALILSREIKQALPKVRSVFGGHHVFAVPNTINLDGIDIIVKGSVYGTIDKIINSTGKEVISGIPTPVNNMYPARKEYFEAIPRMANRHRKYIMSHFGCLYNCSYCSTSRVRNFYDFAIYKKSYLTRRSVKDMINESKIFLEYSTKEVSLEDDDILVGTDAEEWLEDFSSSWKKEINLPTYANVTPTTVVRASDKSMTILAGLVDSVQMGVQAVTPQALKLFNRLAQNPEVVKKAYKRLNLFNILVKMEFIMGLPIEDPVSDAIESIKLAQELNANFISAFPLMIYPGTDLEKWCKENSIGLNKDCKMEWHTGIGSIQFDLITNRRIKNLVKMAQFFVKYKINERWIRALIDMDLTDDSSKELSKCNYLESLIFRGVKDAEKDFDKIIESMDFKY
ncbi:MAG: radical SAM protein, partial [Nanoarchaeota archaeon]|nr:radical SAM protein [Nanoarchaeota archaeon]